MPLSQQRSLFSIHSMTPYDRITGEFFGILKVLGDAEMSMNASSVDLRGGSNKFSIENETVQIESAFTSNVRTYPDFMFEKWIGAVVNTIAASATGTVGAITNKKGTSTVSATAGIASVAGTTSGEGNLKFGRYIVKVVTTTTVDVYVDTDINFKTKGDPATYVNDLLKITASPITIPDASTVTLGGDFGIEFTGGTTVGMTVDDTAYFDVVPPHGGISDIEMGQSTIILPQFGVFLYAQEKSSGAMFRIQAFKAKSSAGMIIPLTEGNFAITNLGTTLLYDSEEDKVMVARAVREVTS